MKYSLIDRFYLLIIQPQRRLDIDGTLREQVLTDSITYILLGSVGYISVLFPVPESLNASLIGIVCLIAITFGASLYFLRKNLPLAIALIHPSFAIGLITIALWAGGTTASASISMCYMLNMLLIFHFYNLFVSVLYLILIALCFSVVAIELNWDGWQSLLVLLIGCCMICGLLVKLLINRIHELASTDKLTGAFNRHTWDALFEHKLAYARRYDKSLCLMIIDLDEFKVINDKKGHLEGDRILKLTADTIRKTLRSSDIFARWGGDEFVVALHDCDMEEAINMEQRMQSRMKGTIDFSVGIAMCKNNDTADSVLLRADKELFIKKESR